jgi:hypothetical protein
VRLQRCLVDLDAEAGPGGRMQHVAAQLALDRGDGRGEEPLGGQAVGQIEAVLRGTLASVAATCAATANPDRPVEGARQ